GFRVEHWFTVSTVMYPRAMLSPNDWAPQEAANSEDAAPVWAFRSPWLKSGVNAGAGSWPVQVAKLMSCENCPLGLIASWGSWPALAVGAIVPLSRSRTLIVCTSYPVR